MKDTAYLVVNRRGIDRIVKTKRPILKANERVILIEVDVPDAAFLPPPSLKASIFVGLENVGIPEVKVELADPGFPIERPPKVDVPINAVVNELRGECSAWGVDTPVPPIGME